MDGRDRKSQDEHSSSIVRQIKQKKVVRMQQSKITPDENGNIRGAKVEKNVKGK